MSAQASSSQHPFGQRGEVRPTNTRPEDNGNERRPGKRRDTDVDRQKAEASCDRCKQRKRRCLRPRENISCVACDEASAECITTKPSKQRIYATVEQLSVRYRVLDSLIRSLCPDYDIDSLKGLLALAAEKGVDIPRNNGKIAPLDPTHGHAPDSPHGSVNSQRNDLDLDEAVRFDAGPSSRNKEYIPEGWLVAAPKGGSHYVGYSSLVYFAQTARELVKRSRLSETPSFDDASFRRYQRAAEFTSYKVSHTIEAKIQGHPSTVAAGQTDEGVNLPLHMANPVSARESEAAVSPASSRITASYNSTFHLADRPTMDRLVDAFFAKVHPNFALFLQGAFQVKYEATLKSNLDANIFSRDPGWTSSLIMVLVLGAQALEKELGEEARSLQERFLLVLFQQGLERMMLNTSLSTVQALTLLSLYQHNVGERNTAWILLGHAARTAVALGMHRDGENGDFDPFERNTRRIVWWTLHIFEQFISLALGRPSYTIVDAVGVTTALPDSSFTERMGQPPGYLQYAVELAGIFPNVRRFVASTAGSYSSPMTLLQAAPKARTLLADLATWRANLTGHLSLPSTMNNLQHQRLALLLYIWCDYLESVTARPYLLCRVNHDVTPQSQASDLPDEVLALAEVCVSASKSSVEKFLHIASIGMLDGLFSLDFYGIQHATMIISLSYLGQTAAIRNNGNQPKESITTLLSVVEPMTLAPTYRITMNVAMQLAFITGIGPENEVTPPRVPDQSIIQPMDFHFPTTATPAYPGIAMDPINSQSITDSSHFSMDTFDMSRSHDLEQLFGPLPPSRHNSAPDIFADLYNLGLDTSGSKPWDFFNVGELTEAALNNYGGISGIHSIPSQGQN